MTRFSPLFLLAGLLSISACSSRESTTQETGGFGGSGDGATITTNSGLRYDVLSEGEGAAIRNGQVATMHYTGWLYDADAPEGKGAKFDSSRDRDEYFEFKLGEGRVIKGWDEGILGMKPGERRMLTIPPDLGYGSTGAGGAIPPNATLLFDVELIGIRTQQ